MNNSWSKKQEENRNNPGSQPQTSDFIGFSSDNSQSNNERFNPTNYSSPQRHYGQNKRWVNKNRYSDYGHNQQNRSFNASFNSSHNQSFNSSYNRSYSSNSSNHNRSQNRSFSNFGHYKAKQDHNNTFNKQLFLHPSFMEDPWAQLEARLAQRERNEEDTNIKEPVGVEN